MGHLGSVKYFQNSKRPVFFFLVSFDEITGKVLAPFEIIGRFTIEISARFHSKENLILTVMPCVFRT